MAKKKKTTTRRDRIQKANRKLKHLLVSCCRAYDGDRVGAIRLLEKQPKAARIRDEDGNLPLHLYISCWCNQLHVSVVQALVYAYPESISKVNRWGETPLQLICRRHIAALAPSDPWRDEIVPEITAVIRFLIDECPNTLLVRNWNGYTPIHEILYFMERVPELLSLVDFMIEACPEIAKVSNDDQETGFLLFE